MFRNIGPVTQQKCLQYSCLAQQQRNQQSADAPISVKEGMDCLGFWKDLMIQIMMDLVSQIVIGMLKNKNVDLFTENMQEMNLFMETLEKDMNV